MEHRRTRPRFREQAKASSASGRRVPERAARRSWTWARWEAGRMTLARGGGPARAAARHDRLPTPSPRPTGACRWALRSEDTVPATVQVDPLRLKQILNNNLLSNARSSSPNRARCASRWTRRQRAPLSTSTPAPAFRRTGTTIFERFRQGDARVSYQQRHRPPGSSRALGRVGGRAANGGQPPGGARASRWRCRRSKPPAAAPRFSAAAAGR